MLILVVTAVSAGVAPSPVFGQSVPPGVRGALTVAGLDPAPRGFTLLDDGLNAGGRLVA